MQSRICRIIGSRVQPNYQASRDGGYMTKDLPAVIDSMIDRSNISVAIDRREHMVVSNNKACCS